MLGSTSLSQVFLHLAALDKSIKWDRSALLARCRICRRKGDAEKMLLCDKCDRGHHMYCLKPPMMVSRCMYMCVCVCMVFVCVVRLQIITVHACVYMCLHVSVFVCAYMCVCVFADNRQHYHQFSFATIILLFVVLSFILW